MGFFKRMFRRKRGGTRAGNFFRRWAYNKTGGIFGTPDGKPRR